MVHRKRNCRPAAPSSVAQRGGAVRRRPARGGAYRAGSRWADGSAGRPPSRRMARPAGPAGPARMSPARCATPAPDSNLRRGRGRDDLSCCCGSGGCFNAAASAAATLLAASAATAESPSSLPSSHRNSPPSPLPLSLPRALSRIPQPTHPHARTPFGVIRRSHIS